MFVGVPTLSGTYSMHDSDNIVGFDVQDIFSLLIMENASTGYMMLSHASSKLFVWVARTDGR